MPELAADASEAWPELDESSPEYVAFSPGDGYLTGSPAGGMTPKGRCECCRSAPMAPCLSVLGGSSRL